MADNFGTQITSQLGAVHMTAQEEREKEIAAVLKSIYELYGSDLSKFFGQIANRAPEENKLDCENVGRVVRQYEQQYHSR